MKRLNVVVAGARVLALVLAASAVDIASAQVIQGTLDATAPPQSEFYSGQLTTTTSARLFRDGVSSQCGVSKAAPGPFGTGSFRYDVYTFRARETRCHTMRVWVNGGTSDFVHVSVHSSFDPADASANYLADSGSSGIAQGAVLSVDLVAGQTYAIAVFSPTPTEGQSYQLVIDDPLTTVNASTLDATLPGNMPPFAFTSSFQSTQIPALPAPATSCSANKPAPAPQGSGPFRVDALPVMVPVSTCLTVTLRNTSGSAASLAVAAYGHGFFPSSAEWLADSGGATSAPGSTVSFSMTVTAGQYFDLVVMNATPGQEGASYQLTLSTPVQPPRILRTANVSGNDVSFRWAPPIHGPAPTDYVLEGGVSPGQTLASVPLGSANPVTTLSGVPSGSFYIRARSRNGAQTSGPSNEVPIAVNVPAAPATPADVLASVSGSTLAMTWRNTFTGGTPTGLALDVTGSLAGTVPLSSVTDSLVFPGVPGGSYQLRLRATNAAGTSTASAPVSITIPTTCSGAPQPPSDFVVYKVGNQLSLLWDSPTTGAAPLGYVVNVTGAFAGSFPVATKFLSAAVPPGTYNFTVQSTHACGTSVPTAVRSITIP
ncbi:MAG: fibronectin type III domain-containing protein [Vicinamibacterales bacterium]